MNVSISPYLERPLRSMERALGEIGAARRRRGQPRDPSPYRDSRMRAAWLAGWDEEDNRLKESSHAG